MSKRKRLRDRAEKFARNRRGMGTLSVLQKQIARENMTDGWLLGYRAAVKDKYEETYSRKFCAYCFKPKDGCKHEFCKKCKRATDFGCECNVPMAEFYK